MYFSAMGCAGEVILAQPDNNVSYLKIKLNMKRYYIYYLKTYKKFNI